KAAGSVAFALADPITKESYRAKLATEFIEHCRRNGWRACFLLVPQSSIVLYEPKLKLFRVGSSAVISVGTFGQSTLHNKWWRWQANRARRLGYEHEVFHPPHSASFMTELRTISDAWLTRPGHREQAFALGHFNEQYLQACNIHVLKDVT